MVYTVSITSQGQISIPVAARRFLGLKKRGRALVRIDGDQLTIKPIKDVLELEGSLKTKKKSLSAQKMRALFEANLARL
ncbi:hypothetical protein A2630_00475 [Candidatus Woesebacteria bacterium RIFCSPHIGHO2_01_FULL_44_10]|uniref:SpoVT-AbrB domain-containing protein n=1 Tax=Candidatus Woesebacteria bacterium RIFCSPLOWO2_01_FULL_44_14 TaxID=1802525 RepID=A0A1F8C1R0_9BACT|nr:MAG: hypothetical protein A2630_00475 [Candidatus Woesebacteria bacterium RIFCSPHIGHO2_01_FULL_44_10]OGM54398.1 MAG: hypothetical protein A3F62_01450 [Candidatus Woesebacteria bacterium RIFCSPHIGHO2_12_FULL_44_11]OGM70301.1 MAG: hypothetical protein A2975_04500 [Candidatus Woesebacteria bacterium RIFCSPLOWO2_01_FULL_44_14]